MQIFKDYLVPAEHELLFCMTDKLVATFTLMAVEAILYCLMAANQSSSCADASTNC